MEAIIFFMGFIMGCLFSLVLANSIANKVQENIIAVIKNNKKDDDDWQKDADWWKNDE